MPEPRANEVMQDAAIERQAQILRYVDNNTRGISARFNGLEMLILASLRSANIMQPQRLNERLRRLNVALGRAGPAVDALYEALYTDNVSDIAEITGLVIAHVQATIANYFAPHEIPLERPDRLTVQESISGSAAVQGDSLRAWWTDQAQTYKTSLGRISRRAVVQGQTLGELTDALDAWTSTAINRADSLYSTSLVSGANSATLAMYRENTDIIRSIQWIATLDTRTSDICKGLDGLYWDAKSLAPIGTHKKAFPGPVAHFGCRSTQAAGLKSIAEIEQENSPSARAIARATEAGDGPGRSSLDGRVPRSQTYELWLRNKEAQQPGYALEKGILSPGKYKLWKAGRITTRDLVTQRGNAATLGEIEEKLAA